jgi:hypothetical protein
VSDRHYRFTGEVTVWPQRWTIKGNPYTPITCAGVMRRLGQGSAPLQSPMRRACGSLGSALVGYWPMEDLSDATSIAGVLGSTMAITGTPTMAGYEDFAASDPLPTIESARFLAIVSPHADSGYSQIRWLGYIPAGTADGVVIARFAYTGTCVRVDVVYNTATAGTLSAIGYDRDGTSLGSVILASGVTGGRLRVSVELDQNGANIDALMSTYQVGATTGYYQTGTFTGGTIGRAAAVQINPNFSALTGAAVGHLTVETAITDLYTVSTAVLRGHLGEAADSRMVRLGAENDVDVQVIGYGGAAVDTV